jgi:hypothetical protein
MDFVRLANWDVLFVHHHSMADALASNTSRCRREWIL